MSADNLKKFTSAMGVAGVIYNREISKELLSAYWQILKKYDSSDIQNAFMRHFKNTEKGQFFPKPADIISLIEGTSEDRALKAWGKVDSAIKEHGAYASVSFDDDVIHSVISEMGGWINLCHTKTTEMPFKAINFQKIYKSCLLSNSSNNPKYLKGLLELHNRSALNDSNNPVVCIGKPHKIEKSEDLGHSNPLSASNLRAIFSPTKKIGVK